MGSDIKLHLGCGSKYIPGFIHVDLGDYDHIDHCADMRDLSMFEAESVSLIYVCHALEYFDRLEVNSVLLEWNRVLKKGGVLRISVPDFASVVAIYQKYGDLDHQGILGPMYGRWQNSNSNDNLYHKTVYDFGSIEKVLLKNDFRSVQRYDSALTSHAEFDDYSQAFVPHMDRENGILLSLNVEADK